MTDFRELTAPSESTGYEYSGWYVAAEHRHDAKRCAWLATTGEVISDKSDMPILFFDTELEALEASFKYYTKHGKVYPHASMTFTIGSMGESQVMEFE